MSVLNIYSNNVKYVYKVRVCSFSALVVLTAILFALLTPLIFVYHAGGYWIKSRTFWEKPKVHFKHKYFLLIEQDSINPLICSTFSHYKDNVIYDDCNLVKVHEVDNDRSGFKDSLQFEVLFFTDKPIKSLILLLFFNYELQENIHVITEAMSIINYAVAHDVQELYFLGDLVLHQNNLLMHDGIYYLKDNSTDLNDFTLSDLLIENKNRILSGRIKNLKVIPKYSFTSTEPISIRVEVLYAMQSINYQPGFWEEMKWAWMQYLSILVIVIYVAKKVLTKMFFTKRLRSHIVVPWKQK